MTKPLKILVLVLGCTLFVACNEKKQEVFSIQDISIIPEPVQLVLGEGTFEFNTETQFVATDKGQRKISIHPLDLNLK